MINFNNIEKYIENNRIEAKKSLGGLPHSIWETYSAFANTFGGIILLGVEEHKDKSFHPINLPDPKKLIEEFFYILNNTEKVSKNILSDEDVNIITVDGKNIIAIEIPRAKRNDRPIFIGGNISESYRRNGEGDYKCTKEEISSMIRDASIETYDMQVLTDKDISCLNNKSVDTFCNMSNIKNNVDIPGAFHKFDNNNFHLTVAGLLMFGKYEDILSLFPFYSLNYYDNNDYRSFEGNIFDFYLHITNWILNKIKRASLDSFVEKIINESIANCLIHADYKCSGKIEIGIMDGVITISNPGTFRIDVEKAKSGGISDPRNQAISNMFNMIKIGTGTGSGISSIYSICQKRKWPAPIITENTNPPQTTLMIFTDEISKNDIIKKKSFADITVKQAAIINYLTEKITAKTSDISALLNISPSSSRKLLKLMEQNNIIVHSGKTRGRLYRLKS